MPDENGTIEPEVLKDEIQKRRTVVPSTLSELAALKGEAIEIVEARIQVLETLRKAAIRMTHPTDWILYRSDDGNVTGYLQDCGCDRVRDLYGIEVYDVNPPEKISGIEGEFTYIVRGSARCKLTRQVLEDVEGGRSSTDDFCKDKEGAELELTVRKAARANLDGNLTRELSGLKNVPLSEIEAAYSASSKKVDGCRLGRGFGTKKERDGTTVVRKGTPTDVPIPQCSKCNNPMDYIAAGEKDGNTWRAYWKCKQYVYDRSSRTSNGHDRFEDSVYRQALEKRAAQQKQAQEQQAPREPGQEG
jgi:hypothetical protein